MGDMLEANGYTANVSISSSQDDGGNRTRPVHRMEDEICSWCEIMDVLRQWGNIYSKIFP